MGDTIMKTFLLAAMAATLVTTPILAAPAEAQNRRVEQTTRYKPNGSVVVKRQVVQQNPRAAQRQAARQWRKGQRFDRRYATNSRQIDYRSYRQRGLYSPPRSYQWVRSGNDAVLVALASGVID
jgi:Ni/Co efflux regulator RcnB